MIKYITMIALIIFGFILFTAAIEIPHLRYELPELADYYLNNAVNETGALNVVSAILLDYRAFDTIIEASVVFAAVAAIVMLFSKRHLPVSSEGLSILTKEGIMLVIPFIFMLGMYIILHGHLSPGGGFQGGVVIAALTILLCIVFGTAYEWRAITPKTKTLIECTGALLFLFIGITSLLLGNEFLTNIKAGFPPGEQGALFSAGSIPLINLGIGAKVGAGLALIFYSMIKRQNEQEEGEEDN